MLSQTCVFASSGIYQSRSVFRCVRAMKHRCTICHAKWDQYIFHKKCTGKHYAKLVLLHLMGSVGHVVHSDAFGPRYINILFVILGWVKKGIQQKRTVKRYAELVFLHPMGLWVT
jgi:hypothetical protein